MANCIDNIPYSDEKVSKAFNVVKHTLEAAHQIGKVKLQTSDIRKVLETTDYDLCFNTAQRFLGKYRRMINSYTPLTGVTIIDITPEEAYSKDVTYWQSALRFTEMLIYVNEAIHYGLQSVIEGRLEKLFSQDNKTGEGNNGSIENAHS